MNDSSSQLPAPIANPLSRDIPSGHTEEVKVAPVHSIRPARGWIGPDFRQIWQYHELLFTLSVRDIKLRYRQTALGVIWVIIQPLMAAGVLSFIFNAVAKLPGSEFMSVFCGFLGWNVFATTLTRASGSIVGHSGLISKIYFPRLILPFSTAFSALLDFVVAFSLLIILLPLNHITPGVGMLLIPVWLFFLILLAEGIAVVAAGLMVPYRDVGYILPVMINLLMYASPVAFNPAAALKGDSKLQAVFTYNPLTGLINAIRWSILGGDAPDWSMVMYAAGISVLVFFIGIFSFKRMERNFADVI